MTQTAENHFVATGRRKTAVARVILSPGSGEILVNKRPLADFFPRHDLRQMLQEPLEAVGVETHPPPPVVGQVAQRRTRAA